MNKILMKVCCMCIVSCFGVISAHAEDANASVAAVAERTDCAAVQAEIQTLGAAEELSAEETERLNALQTVYRRDCAKRANGRGSVRAARSVPVTTSVAEAAVLEAPVVIQNALEKYLGVKTENCNTLKAELDAATADTALQKQMQAQYDMDCVTIAVSADGRTAAEIAEDNLNAGLCADGTEPNKFGCCTGETFRDMGNATFMCCSKDGGECLPPMNNGRAL